MKRTLWSLLVSAAAVFPALHGVCDAPAYSADAVPEPAAARPAPQTEAVRRAEPEAEALTALREEDSRHDVPASIAGSVSAVPTLRSPRPPLEISAVPLSPDVSPKSRRALGRPRTRQPDSLG